MMNSILYIMQAVQLVKRLETPWCHSTGRSPAAIAYAPMESPAYVSMSWPAGLRLGRGDAGHFFLHCCVRQQFLLVAAVNTEQQQQQPTKASKVPCRTHTATSLLVLAWLWGVSKNPGSHWPFGLAPEKTIQRSSRSLIRLQSLDGGGRQELARFLLCEVRSYLQAAMSRQRAVWVSIQHL